jgi:SOS-response transcriptional repressor LexA
VIEAAMGRTGRSPTFAELQRALGLRSKSSVTRLLGSLEERGMIARLPNRACAIRLIRGGGAPSALAILPPLLARRFGGFCARTGQRPADVIADLVGLYLDEIEGRARPARGSRPEETATQGRLR